MSASLTQHPSTYPQSINYIVVGYIKSISNQSLPPAILKLIVRIYYLFYYKEYSPTITRRCIIDIHSGYYFETKYRINFNLMKYASLRQHRDEEESSEDEEESSSSQGSAPGIPCSTFTEYQENRQHLTSMNA